MRNFAILFLIWLPSLVSAGPDKVSTYLTNEPATLMDLGILRLELFLADFSIGSVSRIPAGIEVDVNELEAWVAKNKLGVSVSVSYNPEEDALNVTAKPKIPISIKFGSTSQLMPPVSTAQLIEWCQWTIEDLRSLLNMPVLYDLVFSHYGYVRVGKGRPENLGAKVASKVRLNCITPAYSLEHVDDTPLCTSSLTSEKIYCSDN